MNPGGSVKDRAARRHRERAAERGELRRRRHGRRGHRRQHRHRPCARVQRSAATAASSSCRTISPPEKYQPAGDAGRGGSPGSGRALQQSQPVPEGRPASGRRARRMRSGRISSTTRPTATRTFTPPGRRSGSRPAAAWMPSWPRAARAARSPVSRSFSSHDAQACAACSPTPRAAACTLTCAPARCKPPARGSITEGIGIGRVTANLEGRAD